jgi:hypothetical protein
VNRLNINLITLAVGLAFNTGAMTQGMSEGDYQAGKDRIAAEHKSAKANCASLSGNANDICVAEAKGKERIPSAEFEASSKPSAKTRYEARVAKAQAQHAVAKERCDDMAGNAKDICVKEAKAVETSAKADAKAQLKTSDANAVANEKSSDAHSKANKQAADARKEAAQDKLAAQYEVAKQRCDVYAGAAKDVCLDRAKTSVGKP